MAIVIEPYIPETITVHLGPPNAPAENVTVSFADNAVPFVPAMQNDAVKRCRLGLYLNNVQKVCVRNSVITASVPEGKVDAGTAVVLKASGDGNIYYTTDGSTPDKYAAKYTAPIILNEDTVIKAVVWNGGNYYSDVFTYYYYNGTQ